MVFFCMLFQLLQVLDSKSFALPCSRKRVWGVFSHCCESLSVKKEMEARVEQVWSFVQRCQTSQAEDLFTVLNRAGLFSGQEDGQPEEHAPRRPGKRGFKWQEEHKAFVQREGLDLEPFAALRDSAREKNLTDREADLLTLKCAFLCKGKVQDEALQGLYAIAIGDSLSRARLCRRHPCLLPAKKYVYVLNGKIWLSHQNPRVPLALQGLGPAELEMAGIKDQLKGKDAQDLAGNGMTSTLLSSILLGVVLADQ